MCGIIGFIGRSSNSFLSNYLVSSLLFQSEIRGKDACGFYAIGHELLFYKNNIPPSEMVASPEWHNIKYINPYLFIGHARAATSGIPHYNKNNQPFVNDDLSLVHNGRVNEYNCLRDEYQLESDCDSEVLLKIYKKNRNICDVLNSVTGPSAFAIASANRLLLFRNAGRPLWLIDLRKHLNQIFFCSTQEIWLKCGLNLDVDSFCIGENELWSLSLEENVIVKKFIINYNILN